MSIYLDHCATTALSENVKNDIINNFDNFGNPSSIYDIGSKSKEVIDRARKSVADCINCRPSEIYFTSGASEANTWALQNPFYCLPYEHHSILNNPNRIKDILKSKIVEYMYVNNEIGFINDIKSLRQKYSNYQFHCDATQAIGNINVDVQKINVDTISFSGHKFNAPKGVGCLYIRKGIKLPQLIYGGKQESGLRGGTENILGISAMGVAIQDAYNNLNNKQQHCKMLKDHMVKTLKHNGIDFIINELKDYDVVSSILSISIRGVENEAVLLRLNLKGIYISSGSACNSGSLNPNKTLDYVKVPQDYINGTLRISFGLENTIAEINIFCKELTKIIYQLSLQTNKIN